MFLSAFNRCLATEFKLKLLPTAVRFYTRPVLCNKNFSKCQADLNKQQNNFFQNGNLTRLAQEQNMAVTKQAEQQSPTPQRTSIWEYPPKCCKNPCPDIWPRFDSLYYKPTDLAKRKYQQTWVECPAAQPRPRKLCPIDTTKLPPLYPRKKPDCLTTAREFNATKLQAVCSTNSYTKCLQVQSPCCALARYPPNCRISKPLTNCKKPPCPTLCYSECVHPKPAPVKKKECSCTLAPAICDVVRYLKRKLAYGLPPPIPAWPT